jgi:hypothetical protein
MHANADAIARWWVRQYIFLILHVLSHSYKDSLFVPDFVERREEFWVWISSWSLVRNDNGGAVIAMACNDYLRFAHMHLLCDTDLGMLLRKLDCDPACVFPSIRMFNSTASSAREPYLSYAELL